MKKPIILSRDQKRLPVQVSRELSRYHSGLKAKKAVWKKIENDRIGLDPLDRALKDTEFRP